MHLNCRVIFRSSSCSLCVQVLNWFYIVLWIVKVNLVLLRRLLEGLILVAWRGCFSHIRIPCAFSFRHSSCLRSLLQTYRVVAKKINFGNSFNIFHTDCRLSLIFPNRWEYVTTKFIGISHLAVSQSLLRPSNTLSNMWTNACWAFKKVKISWFRRIAPLVKWWHVQRNI